MNAPEMAIISWLDDMEAADPACPDPWAAPAYAPATSPEIPAQTASAAGERARPETAGLEPRHGRPGGGLEQDQASRSFTFAEDAVGLFLEYRDVHGRAEDEARAEALGEVAQGLHAWAEADEALNPSRTIGRDWRALREAEARAREAGLGVSVPHPDGRGSPGYQADADAWGTGCGIEPDGPEPRA